MVKLTLTDRFLAAAQHALEAISGHSTASRPYPPRLAPTPPEIVLSEAERREAIGLMRVDHVGEVCAQALYEAQALGARDGTVRGAFERASREEVDHLAWTQTRLQELGGRPSALNPLWYAGAFTIGLVASRLGDRISLGFMAETERQVEEHLLGHLERLPPQDHASRAILASMKEDERGHAQAAAAMGGVELPAPARWAMRLAARAMTGTAYYL